MLFFVLTIAGILGVGIFNCRIGMKMNLLLVRLRFNLNRGNFHEFLASLNYKIIENYVTYNSKH